MPFSLFRKKKQPEQEKPAVPPKEEPKQEAPAQPQEGTTEEVDNQRVDTFLRNNALDEPKQESEIPVLPTNQEPTVTTQEPTQETPTPIQ